MPLTNGFLNDDLLKRHFDKHRQLLGISTLEEYRTRADVFLGSPMQPPTLQCVRTQGDIVRLDPQTDECGVISADGIIRKFYKATPCNKVPSEERITIKKKGICHEFADNTEYFWETCKKH